MREITPFEIIGRDNIRRDILKLLKSGTNTEDGIMNVLQIQLVERLESHKYNEKGIEILDYSDIYVFPSKAFERRSIRKILDEMMQERTIQASWRSTHLTGIFSYAQ